MSDENLYLKHDLIDHADPESVDYSYSGAMDRGEAVRASLPDDARVVFKRRGSYQGEYALVVQYGGYLWVSTGSYGSCSYCDGYIDHEEEETKRLLREAYCFRDADDAREWVRDSEAIEVSYGSADVCLRNALDELDL